MHDFVAEESLYESVQARQRERPAIVLPEKEGIYFYPFPRPRLPSSTSTPLRQDDRWMEGQDKNQGYSA